MRIRPSWDEYFLVQACAAALRSEDPDIRHGALIVNDQNHIIGTGYNGPIKGSDNSVIPFGVRDEKRKWMIHAEENAMLNATQSSSVRGDSCRLYVTGQPCNPCLQRIINFGIKKIVMIDRLGSITEDAESAIMRDQILRMSGLELVKFPASNPWVKKSIEFALS